MMRLSPSKRRNREEGIWGGEGAKEAGIWGLVWDKIIMMSYEVCIDMEMPEKGLGVYWPRDSRDKK